MKVVSLVPSQGESISREFDRGRNHLFQRKLAKFLLSGDHSGDRSGHTDRFIAIFAGSFDHVALRVEVHVTGRRRGSLLTIIEEVSLAVGHADQHESAASDVSRRGMYDSEGKAGSHCRVDGIPAGL